MNTKKIYVASLGVIRYKDCIEPGENMAYFHNTGKMVLVKESIHEGRYIDLENRRKYECKYSNINEEFLVPETFKSFNEFTGNKINNLSKSKVLSLYRNKRR